MIASVTPELQANSIITCFGMKPELTRSRVISRGALRPSAAIPPMTSKKSPIKMRGNLFGAIRSEDPTRFAPQRLQYFNPSTESMPHEEQYICQLRLKRRPADLGQFTHKNRSRLNKLFKLGTKSYYEPRMLQVLPQFPAMFFEK